MSASSVLLPAPLGATSPVRPGPTVKDRSSKTGVSSGQANDRWEQTIEAGVTAADTSDTADSSGDRADHDTRHHRHAPVAAPRISDRTLTSRDTGSAGYGLCRTMP